MYKFKHNKKTYSIPSGWHEITFRQWKELQETEDQNEIISILTGLTVDMAKRLDDKSRYNLNNLLSFLTKKLLIDRYKAPDNLNIKVKHKKIEIPRIEDIKAETFGQKIYIHELVSNNDEDLITKIVDIVLVYSQPIIEGKDFDIKNFSELSLYFDDLFLVDLYSTAMSYIEQLKKILDREKKVLSSEPTSDQVMAGIDRFDKFGVINTINAVAKEYNQTWEQVEREDYNTVFTKLALSKTNRAFQNDYREVMKRKNKQ